MIPEVMWVDFTRVRAHVAHWDYGGIPNSDNDYAALVCSCGWRSSDLYTTENYGELDYVNPEEELRLHLSDVGEPVPSGYGHEDISQ